MTDDLLYGPDFYQQLTAGASRSARVVLPEVFALTGVPGSVLDVGCGLGAWAAECLPYGCGIHAVDGAHIDQQQLLIPADRFTASDLSRDGALGPYTGFDLTLCLEVAEHLPPSRSDSFIRELCGTARRVLFSAAVPGQIATGHINCQWQGEWAHRFISHGWTVSTALRDRLWNDPRVECWYRQNILLAESPDMRGAMAPGPFNVIHPDMWAWFAPAE